MTVYRVHRSPSGEADGPWEVEDDMFFMSKESAERQVKILNTAYPKELYKTLPMKGTDDE